MIILEVNENDKEFAKQQIEAFKKIDAGSWRYSNVIAWRGIVCEMVAGKWFENNFTVEKSVKGLDNSGIVDECDMLKGICLFMKQILNQKIQGRRHKRLKIEFIESMLVLLSEIIINSKKIEIKSATKNYFKYMMPKIHDVRDKPKDIYIGVKYNETVEPNQVIILGYIKHSEILKYPIKQNKGAPYYEVPLSKLLPINQKKFS